MCGRIGEEERGLGRDVVSRISFFFRRVVFWFWVEYLTFY